MKNKIANKKNLMLKKAELQEEAEAVLHITRAAGIPDTGITSLEEEEGDTILDPDQQATILKFSFLARSEEYLVHKLINNKSGLEHTI